ncbi:MAG: recombinase family protein [Nitrospiria bacterium]
MNIGIYARVSTSDKNQDPENQLRELRAYCKAREFEILKEYVDVGQSGAKDSRPKLNDLLNDARKRKIDAILVWRMDRFSRDLKFLFTTIDSLNQIGIGFISYHENLDLTTAAGRLQMQVFSAFAEYEKNVIKERVLSGLQKLEKQEESEDGPERAWI